MDRWIDGQLSGWIDTNGWYIEKQVFLSQPFALQCPSLLPLTSIGWSELLLLTEGHSLALCLALVFWKCLSVIPPWISGTSPSHPIPTPALRHLQLIVTVAQARGTCLPTLMPILICRDRESLQLVTGMTEVVQPPATAGFLPFLPLGSLLRSCQGLIIPWGLAADKPLASPRHRCGNGLCSSSHVTAPKDLISLAVAQAMCSEL